MRRSPFVVALYIWGALCGIFLALPLVVVLINSIGVERYVVFPPSGYTLAWYGRIPETYLHSAIFSLLLATCAVIGASLLAVPAALALVRGRLPGRSLVDGMLRSPLQIPLLVSGVAFIQFYGFLYDNLHIDLYGKFAGLLLAHIVVVSPYILTATVAQLAKYDAALDEAAYGMGAYPWATFWRITFPIIRPSILAGTFFAFLMSFDNVPLTIFLIQPGRSTLPVDLFFSTEQDLSRVHYAVGTLVTIVSATSILLIQRYLGVGVPDAGKASQR